jgi:hypothetical protein
MVTARNTNFLQDFRGRVAESSTSRSRRLNPSIRSPGRAPILRKRRNGLRRSITRADPNPSCPYVLRRSVDRLLPPALARTLGQHPANARSGKTHGPIEPIFAIAVSLAEAIARSGQPARAARSLSRHSTAFVRGMLFHDVRDSGSLRRAPIASSLHFAERNDALGIE